MTLLFPIKFCHHWGHWHGQLKNLSCSLYVHENIDDPASTLYHIHTHIYTYIQVCVYKINDYTFLLKIYSNRKALLVKMQVNSVNLWYFLAEFSKIKASKGSREGNYHVLIAY